VRTQIISVLLLAMMLLFGCSTDQDSVAVAPAVEQQPAAAEMGASAQEPAQGFQVEAERFADLRILRYQVPGFESLSLIIKQEKKLE